MSERDGEVLLTLAGAGQGQGAARGHGGAQRPVSPHGNGSASVEFLVVLDLETAFGPLRLPRFANAVRSFPLSLKLRSARKTDEHAFRSPSRHRSVSAPSYSSPFRHHRPRQPRPPGTSPFAPHSATPSRPISRVRHRSRAPSRPRPHCACDGHRNAPPARMRLSSFLARRSRRRGRFKKTALRRPRCASRASSSSPG